LAGGRELAIAQQHVNDVVAAQADVQHDERNRQEIQLADRDGGKRGRQRQTRDERRERRDEQPPRAKRRVQHECDHDQGRERADAGAAADAQELLVLHRNGSREADRRAVRREPFRDRANVGNRGGGRLHSAEVDGRLHCDDSPDALARRIRRRPGDHSVPGKRRDLAVAGVADRPRELLIEGVEPGRAARLGCHRSACDVQNRGAVESLFEQPQQRLRRGEPVRQPRELGRPEVQKAVALEELSLTRQER
jgi:hypothetical protein